jgi:hypothetical protein
MTDIELKDIPVSHLKVVRDEAEAKKDEAKGLLGDIQAMPMEWQDDFDFGATVLTDIREQRKALENERGKATRGLLDTLNVIRGWFKPTLDHLSACETALKAKMGAYTQEQQRRQQEALRAAGEASMQGDAAVAQRALQTAHDAQVHKAPGARIQSVLRYQVEDLNKVPREFLCLDPAAVERHLQHYGAAAQIPGIKVWEDTKIVGQAVR